MCHFDNLQGTESLVFYHKCFLQYHFYFNNMCTKFEDQKIYQKILKKSTHMCSHENNFNLPTLTTSQGLKKTFFHEISRTTSSLC